MLVRSGTLFLRAPHEALSVLKTIREKLWQKPAASDSGWAFVCEVGERKSVHVYTRAKKERDKGEGGREKERDAHMLGKSKSGGEKQRTRETDRERERLSDGTEIDFGVSKHNVRRFTKQLGSSSSQKHLNANHIKIEHSVIWALFTNGRGGWETCRNRSEGDAKKGREGTLIF